jgi:hypothetical protein
MSEKKKSIVLVALIMIAIIMASLVFLASWILFKIGIQPHISSIIFEGLLTTASILFGLTPAITFFSLERLERTKHDALPAIRHIRENLQTFAATLTNIQGNTPPTQAAQRIIYATNTLQHQMEQKHTQEFSRD